MNDRPEDHPVSVTSLHSAPVELTQVGEDSRLAATRANTLVPQHAIAASFRRLSAQPMCLVNLFTRTDIRSCHIARSDLPRVVRGRERGLLDTSGVARWSERGVSFKHGEPISSVRDPGIEP